MMFTVKDSPSALTNVYREDRKEGLGRIEGKDCKGRTVTPGRPGEDRTPVMTGRIEPPS